MAVSFDTPSPSRAFLEHSMPPTVVGCHPTKGTFAPEGLVAILVRLGRIMDVEPTLRVMLCTMAEFAMLVL